MGHRHQIKLRSEWGDTDPAHAEFKHPGDDADAVKMYANPLHSPALSMENPETRS